MSIVQSLNPGTPDGFTNEDMMHLLEADRVGGQQPLCFALSTEAGVDKRQFLTLS